ncbi:MAG: DUF885 domain-containing protein [Phycisphaerae bacterium]|jgi:uncharacterized protein (DUF885 family)|nr:DUF885 domain-containing protein [Phycisphaerae bacterium]
MRLKVWRLAILAAALIGCGQAPSADPGGGEKATGKTDPHQQQEQAMKVENQKFEALGKEYLDRVPALSPIRATRLGDHRFDAEVDQVTAEARGKKLHLYRQWLEKLAAIDEKALTRNNRIDHQLLTNKLEYSVWALETLREWEWNPLVYTKLTGGGIYDLMAREFAPVPTRLARVADRLKKYPKLFEQIRATLKIERIPKVHAETAVNQNRGMLSIIATMVLPHLEQLPQAEAKRLRAAIDEAKAAVNQHQKWLEEEVLPNANGDFRLGAELYDKKLGFTLNSPLTRKQIADRARSELNRVRREMYKTAFELTAGKSGKKKPPADPSDKVMNKTIGAALELAYRERPEKGKILEEAKKALTLTTDFVREEDLVTIPKDPVEIIPMPEFKRGVALAYCDSPGPLDAGQKTFYAVSPLPEDWTAEQVESHLREYNLRSVYNLTIHEAMPGHHLQLAHANAFGSKLRAMLSSGVFIEGWAVYTEKLMLDNGFLHGDPLMQLISQKWYLRAVANAIIDQEVHTGRMTRKQAMTLMLEKTFQEEREAAGKWTRARLTAAQLATYFVGYLEHADMRREVEKAWGKQFTLKKYHDKILSFGSPPVRFVRALILDQPIGL